MKILIGIEKLPSNWATISCWHNANISNNKYMFYIHDDLFGDAYIHKDSKEGKELEKLLTIEKNRNNEFIKEKLFEIALPKMKYQDFINIIEKQNEDFYKEGYRKAQYDIRCALGF